MIVEYTGRADVRTLNAADLARLGVEGFKKTEFPKNKSVEVEEQVGIILTKHDIFNGEFQVTDAPNGEVRDPLYNPDLILSSAPNQGDSESSASDTGDTSSTTGTTGRGSTRTRAR